MPKLIETQPPAAEPLALDDVKAYLRLTSTADDALITALIIAARQACEAFTGLALVSRQYSLFCDVWPRPLELPRPPLISVAGVYVYGADNAATALDVAEYTVDAAAYPARIVANNTPPAAGRDVNGIEVRYTAGYGAGTDVPALLKLGMKQYIAWVYSHRGDDGQADALSLSGARMLFQPYRVMRLA